MLNQNSKPPESCEELQSSDGFLCHTTNPCHSFDSCHIKTAIVCVDNLSSVNKMYSPRCVGSLKKSMTVLRSIEKDVIKGNENI